MDIFVSRPTWVSTEFEAGLKVFLTSLTNMGLVPRTLGSSDYPSKAPLDEVIEIMDECKGAVILGYPQVLVSQGAVKGCELEIEMLLPTEWNHIEAALAYSKGIPLILFHHKGVSRGVFDRGSTPITRTFLKRLKAPNHSSQLDVSSADCESVQCN